MPDARKERLLREMWPEPVPPFRTVINCAAGLAILTALATLGPGMTGFHTFAGEGSHSVRAADSASDRAPAVAHRKFLFDERRARFTVAHVRVTVDSPRHR